MPNQKNISQFQDITKKLNESQAVYLVNHQGLGANDLTELRSQIREVGGQMVVVKNTLFKLALRKLEEGSTLKINDLSGLEITGTSAALFAKTDQVAPLKVVVKYAKDKELPTLKLGFLNHRLLNTEEVHTLAKLPGQDELRAQVVGMLQSPITRLLGSLQGNLSKLVIVLSEIGKTKTN